MFVYQIESYRFWQEQLHRSDFVYGQFGENFTIEGLPDDVVCIGDRFRIGSAVFEVTQPRVTCYRVGIRMSEPRMPALLTSSGRPGFYFRVIQEGEVGAGDEIIQVGSAADRMTVTEINALLYSPAHTPERLERALRIEALSAGWRASFYVCAAIGLVAGIIWYLAARDTPQEHPAVNRAELDHIERGLSPAATGPRGPVPWRAMLTSRNVWGLFLSYFAFGYVIWIFFSWFYIYLAEARHLDLKASAAYAMLPFLCMTLGCLAGGVINDAISRRYGLYWGRSGLAVVAFVLTGTFLLLGSTVDNVLLAVVILAGGAGAIYLSQSSFWSVTADIAGPHTGVVSGFMNMGCQIGGAVTSSLTPWIAAQYGWAAAFAAGAAVVLLGVIAWAIVDPNRPLLSEQPEPATLTAAAIA